MAAKAAANGGAASPAASATKAAAPTDAASRKEAWRAVSKLLRQVFPLRAVLACEKPVAALKGLRLLVLMTLGITINSFVLDQYNDVLRRLAATIYLRDWALFKRQTALAVVTSLCCSLLKIHSSRMYLRLAALWRHEMTLAIQAEYARSQAFYRLTQSDSSSAIADADQRIAEDIKAVTQNFASMWYRVMTYSTGLVSSTVRLAMVSSPRYVFICLGYMLACNKLREIAAPVMRVGMLTGEISHATGEYHSAQLRLLENSETVVSLRGTQLEKRAILASYEKLREKQIQTNKEALRDTWWYSGVVTVITTPTLQAILVEMPFITRAGQAAYETSQVSI